MGSNAYDELEGLYTLPKGLGRTPEETESLEGDLYFMEDDANVLLANIGLDQRFDLSKYPREQLLRIFRFYHVDSEKMVDGKKEYVDPLPNYVVGSDSFEDELYKFGYELGRIGTIGIYYRLLPDYNFRFGYWTGKMEKAIELQDDRMMVEVAREMKVYDVEKADKELENVVNGIYAENEPGRKGPQ